MSKYQTLLVLALIAVSINSIYADGNKTAAKNVTGPQLHYNSSQGEMWYLLPDNENYWNTSNGTVCFPSTISFDFILTKNVSHSYYQNLLTFPSPVPKDCEEWGIKKVMNISCQGIHLANNGKPGAAITVQTKVFSSKNDSCTYSFAYTTNGASSANTSRWKVILDCKGLKGSAYYTLLPESQLNGKTWDLLSSGQSNTNPNTTCFPDSVSLAYSSNSSKAWYTVSYSFDTPTGAFCQQQGITGNFNATTSQISVSANSTELMFNSQVPGNSNCSYSWTYNTPSYQGLLQATLNCKGFNSTNAEYQPLLLGDNEELFLNFLY